MELLEKVGLADKADVSPDSLSGGQKTGGPLRVVGNEARCHALDEPTSALTENGRGRTERYEGFGQARDNYDYRHHEMGFARQVANRVIFYS